MGFLSVRDQWGWCTMDPIRRLSASVLEDGSLLGTEMHQLPHQEIGATVVHLLLAMWHRLEHAKATKIGRSRG